MKNALACWLLGIACVGAIAQSRLPPGVVGPDAGTGAAMATRSVSKYLALERNLLEALKAKDRQTAFALVADGFEARSASDGDAISAEDWLNGELRKSIQTARVRNLAVREFKDVDLVSFFLDSRQLVKGKMPASTLYVVDVWRRAPDQLVARYSSQPAHALPAQPRPSGRE